MICSKNFDKLYDWLWNNYGYDSHVNEFMRESFNSQQGHLLAFGRDELRIKVGYYPRTSGKDVFELWIWDWDKSFWEKLSLENEPTTLSEAILIMMNT